MFGETRAVDGTGLAVRAGSVHGVLGPNGAGKTPGWVQAVVEANPISHLASATHGFMHGSFDG